MARTIDIKKEGDRWKVYRDDSGKKFNRGEPLQWKLHQDQNAVGGPASAQFQFTDDDLFDLPANDGKITKDLTAEIPVGETTLSLKLSPKADRRKNPRYYAVWIVDKAHPKGGVFAVGEDGNPPPQMDIGP